MGTQDFIIHLRSLDRTESFWKEAFGTFRQLTGNYLRESFDEHSSSFVFYYLGACVYIKGTVIPSPSCAVFRTSVSSVFSSIMCCVFFRPDGASQLAGWVCLPSRLWFKHVFVMGRAALRLVHRRQFPTWLHSSASRQFLLLGRQLKLCYQEEAAVVSQRLLGLPV